MISVNQLRHVPGWGETLTNRAKKAGFEVLSRKNVKELNKLYQVGKKRIWEVEKYMARYEAHEKYVVERNSKYEMLDDGKNITIRFFMPVGKVTYYKITGYLDNKGGVRGNLFFEIDGKKYHTPYHVTDKSYWLEIRIYSPATKALMDRMKEVVRERRGYNK